MLTRRALVAPALALAIALAPSLATRTASATTHRLAILVVVAERSYRQALDDPLLSGLAEVGGLGLMTTSGRAEDPARTAVNLGAGASANDAPAGAVPFEQREGGVTVDVVPYVDAADGAIPGLLGSALAGSGLTAGYVGAGSPSGEVALLAAMDREGLIPAASFGAIASAGSLTPEASGMVRGADLLVSSDPKIVPMALEDTAAREVLVVVVGAGASREMHDRGETFAPILVIGGSPDDVLAGDGPPSGLTSATTRRAGMVSDVDVAPTILGFLGAPIPDEMTGASIEPSGDPPSELHERYLGFRRVVGPVGAFILGLAIASLLAGLIVVFVMRRPSSGLARGVALAMVASLALFVATVPASVLPDFDWALVIVSLAVVASAIVALALSRGRRDPRAAVAVLAAAGLVLVALDGLLGWPSQLTPLLGGGALDGERFFGLGNAHAGMVLAGAVLGAARISPRAGTALIAVAAAFAGLPFLGADLGGCVTLAMAAALWFGLGRWGRLGWRALALAAVVAVGAALFVMIGARVLPGGPTHLSRVDGAAIEAYVDRLAANVRTTSANATAWLPVLGLAVWAVVAVRRPARLRPMLEADPRWRDATLVLALTGLVGYLLNDTSGMAGSAFAFVSAAAIYPTLTSFAETPVARGVGRASPFRRRPVRGRSGEPT